MKYDYFIAWRWRNKEQILYLTKLIREKGKTVYCFAEDKEYIDAVDPDPEQFMIKFEALENWQQDPMVKQIFEEDMDGLKSSENFILLLPAGKSAHMEAGIAYGMGKKCILVGEQKETESLYLIFSETYASIEEFIDQIT